MGIKEELEAIIYDNPDIEMRDGEVCFFGVRGKFGSPSLQTTTTVKPGLGLGVVVPVTKHFGLGIGKQKIKTTTSTQTVWEQEPCEFYVLNDRMVLKMKKTIYNLELDKITGLKVNKDAVTLTYNGKEMYIFMSKSDVQRFMHMYDVMGRAQKSGMDLSAYGGNPSISKQIDESSSGYENNKKEHSPEYSQAVFLWCVGKKASQILKRDEYPSYIFYECGIQNGPIYHKKMIKEGYLIESPLEDLLNTLKIDQLKEILQTSGCSTTGKKAALIRRIIEEVPHNKIAEQFPQKMYSLSEKGKAFIEEYNAYIELHTHSNWQISEAEYDTEKAKEPEKTFYMICWRILADRVKASQNYFENRNTFYNLAYIAKSAEQKKVALSMLLRVLYLDLSGSSNTYYDSYKKKWLSKKEFFEKINRDMIFAPGLIKDIGDLEEYYSSEMLTPLFDWDLPVKLCPDSLFEKIVDSIFRGDFDRTEYSQELAAAYKRNI